MNPNEIVVVRLISGETIVATFAGTDGQFFYLAFPYELDDNHLIGYVPITTNRLFPINIGHTIFMKDVKDNVKEAYKQLVLAKEGQEYSGFIAKYATFDPSEKAGTSEHSFFIEGSATMN